MPDPIDYSKCKTDRTGLYVMVILILIGVMGGGMESDKKLDQLLKMQPCQQQQITK